MGFGFRPIAAIDFDGTIKKDPNFNVYGEPMEGCIEAIKRLNSAGVRLILWTCRGYNNPDGSSGGLEEALEYLRQHDILDCFELINKNVPELPFLAFPKIFADYYVDDRGILGLPTWLRVEQIIMSDDYFNKKADDSIV
jgi:hypothetical protein